MSLETKTENELCNACGADVRPGAMFCYSCGSAVAPGKLFVNGPEKQTDNRSTERAIAKPSEKVEFDKPIDKPFAEPLTVEENAYKPEKEQIKNKKNRLTKNGFLVL